MRKIAKFLNVSEGTAYRAIKDADKMGMVATIDRVGTVRIEKRNRNEIEHLTFNEIVNIIDGQVLGGNKGITKMVSKFCNWSNGTQRYFKIYWSKDIIDCPEIAKMCRLKL